MRLTDLIYMFIRGAGHTYAELYGVANNPKAKLIVLDNQQRQHIDLPRNKIITINELDKLRGIYAPIVIDHFALTFLVQEYDKEAQETIATLNKEHEEKEKALSKEINRLDKIIKKLKESK